MEFVKYAELITKFDIEGVGVPTNLIKITVAIVLSLSSECYYE
ncbi:MAG: hypothetical protein RL065_523, partial [Bacteroidota bacterium]